MQQKNVEQHPYQTSDSNNDIIKAVNDKCGTNIIKEGKKYIEDDITYTNGYKKSILFLYIYC